MINDNQLKGEVKRLTTFGDIARFWADNPRAQEVLGKDYINLRRRINRKVTTWHKQANALRMAYGAQLDAIAAQRGEAKAPYVAKYNSKQTAITLGLNEGRLTVERHHALMEQAYNEYFAAVDLIDKTHNRRHDELANKCGIDQNALQIECFEKIKAEILKCFE